MGEAAENDEGGDMNEDTRTVEGKKAAAEMKRQDGVGDCQAYKHIGGIKALERDEYAFIAKTNLDISAQTQR